MLPQYLDHIHGIIIRINIIELPQWTEMTVYWRMRVDPEGQTIVVLPLAGLSDTDSTDGQPCKVEQPAKWPISFLHCCSIVLNHSQLGCPGRNDCL